MLRKFFKKTAMEPELKKAYDMYYPVWHLEKGLGKPLCKTSTARWGTETLTSESVLREVEAEGNDSAWCSQCVSVLKASS